MRKHSSTAHGYARSQDRDVATEPHVRQRDPEPIEEIIISPSGPRLEAATFIQARMQDLGQKHRFLKPEKQKNTEKEFERERSVAVWAWTRRTGGGETERKKRKRRRVGVGGKRG
ncbi:hypothetical protein J4Q44_G00157260 [Coregonus suidteri]|uniref:Uncharacterized protein n=1 Tax=Coregonus suidteri TaxID=861788 RepID=A0AAN8LNJ3_9TELE